MQGCKDCREENITTRRPAPHPGPRCSSHHRQAHKRAQTAAHARRTERIYGITADEYQAIYTAQGGRCYICQRATGKARRLAVDHDHRTGIVRALLCSRCNRLIAFLDPQALRRAITVLTDPPAQHVLISF